MEHIHLEGGNYYHIFNRGNNGCNLFEQPADYERFLWLYDKYISPIADTLAWVLMGNHFHVLVYIKKDVIYKYSLETLDRIAPDKTWFEEHKWETTDLSADLSAFAEPDNVESDNVEGTNNNIGIINAVKSKDVDRLKDADRLKDVDRLKLKTPVPYRHFGHLFNAYSRYLQVRTGRTGNLFERPFKRKLVDDAGYLKQVVVYIHNNPVHHRYCYHSLEYPWSSYIDSMSEKPTKLKRDAIMKLFGNKENFEYQHMQKIDIAEIEEWLEIDPSFIHEEFISDLSAFAEPARLCHSGGPDNVKK